MQIGDDQQPLVRKPQRQSRIQPHAGLNFGANGWWRRNEGSDAHAVKRPNVPNPRSASNSTSMFFSHPENARERKVDDAKHPTARVGPAPVAVPWRADKRQPYKNPPWTSRERGGARVIPNSKFPLLTTHVTG